VGYAISRSTVLLPCNVVVRVVDAVAG